MARIRPQTELLKVLSVLATIPACFLLFSGGYVLVRHAGTYRVADLIEYGALPLVGGLCWLVLAAWFLSRSVGAASLWDSIGTVALRALGAIAAVGGILVIARVVRGE